MEHSERFRVAWVDTDAGGRIHFTAAFRWAEATETGLMRELGLLERWGN
jgi:acyl-CoA thioesterase FadM